MELSIKGISVLIDDEDYERIKEYGWCMSGNGYAIAHIPGSGHFGRKVYLHRLILGCEDRKSYVDHINGNKLDNRRGNLRICTQSENMRNRGPTKKNKLGIKGVCYNPIRDKYEVRLCLNYKTIHIGRFKILDEAIRAYQEAAKKYHGEFAKTV